MNDQGYSHFLARHGLTEAAVQNLMRGLSAPVANETVDQVFRKEVSPIHGVGMFTTRRLCKGELFPVCKGSIRFNLARYVNHSDKPNCIFEFDEEGNGWMRTLASIEARTEITTDYEDNMRKSIAASVRQTRGQSAV